MTGTVSFETVADVQDYFVEHSLGPWAGPTAQAVLDLRLPREMFVGMGLRLVVLNDETGLVDALNAGGEPAKGVLEAMNLLWAARGF